MDYQTIAMEDYPRKKLFEFFTSLGSPYGGMTVDIDITDWLAAVKRAKLPFFHCFLHAVSRAANAVPEFRQRILDGGIIQYDDCPSSYTVSLEQDNYCFCRVETNRPLKEFLRYSQEEQEKARAQELMLGDMETLPLIYTTSTPWIRYSHVILTYPLPADSNPRICWAKYERVGERVILPVTAQGHHALIHGLQFHRFYEALKAELARSATEL